MIGNTWKNIATQLAVLAMFNYTEAKIKTDGLWTENDWYNDEAKLGVENGKPFSKDAEMKRKLESAMALEGTPEDFKNFDNVKRVENLLKKADFDNFFPDKDEKYTYDGFLQAVGKFPKFCGEENGGPLQTPDNACQRELSTLLAHVTSATDKLKQTKNPSCSNGAEMCDYRWSENWYDWYPVQDNAQYYERGALQMSWNYNYGAFSEVLNDNEYDGKMTLLKNPETMETDSYTMFASALWQYMTPNIRMSPNHSIHEIVTGYAHVKGASENDKPKSMSGFGTTTNIITNGRECGELLETRGNSERIFYYKQFLAHFGQGDDEETMFCRNEPPVYPYGSYAEPYLYFDKNTDEDKQCKPVKYVTPYAISTNDSYKRCICDKFGAGADDCKQEPADCSKEPDHDQCVASGRTGLLSKNVSAKDLESLNANTRGVMEGCAGERAASLLEEVKGLEWEFHGERGFWDGEVKIADPTKPHGEGVWLNTETMERYTGYAVEGKLNGLLRKEWKDDDKEKGNFLIFQAHKDDTELLDFSTRKHTVYQDDGKVCNFHDCSKDVVTKPKDAHFGNGNPFGEGMSMTQIELPQLDEIVTIDETNEVTLEDCTFTWGEYKIAAMEDDYKGHDWYGKITNKDKHLIDALRTAQVKQGDLKDLKKVVYEPLEE